MLDRIDGSPRRKGGNIVRTFRNRLPSVQTRCSQQGEPSEHSKKREPSLDHPYMVATARILKRKTERFT